jgi:hypothetical protein
MYRVYSLADGIASDKLDFSRLARNPHPGALELLDRVLKERPSTPSDSVIGEVCEGLSQNSNPNAILILINIFDSRDALYPLWSNQLTTKRVCVWGNLSRHQDPLAMTILSKRPNKIEWHALSKNPSPAAADLLRKYPGNIIWNSLARNTGKCAIALMAAHLDRVDWDHLAHNTAPEAVALMEAHLDRVSWYNLLLNPAPEAAALVEANLDRLRVNSLDRHTEALILNHSPAVSSIIADNIRRIMVMSDFGETNTIKILSANPNIFTEKYDYAAMRAAMDVHREELAKAAFHPRRLARHLAAGGKIDDF